MPLYATAPALLFVAFLMAASLGALSWDNPTDYIPALIIVLMMPLSYSIATGIGLGFIAYVALKALTGRFSEINAAVGVIAPRVPAQIGLCLIATKLCKATDVDLRDTAKRSLNMQTYILLVNFTDQGMRNIKDTIGRAHAFEDMAKKSGAVIKVLCWTIGRYDVIAVFEAPDDESATALGFSASSLGNTRAEILRAFSFEEMSEILAKMV